MTVLNQNNREDNLGKNNYNDNIFGEYFVFRDPRKLKIWFSKGFQSLWSPRNHTQARKMRGLKVSDPRLVS